MISYELVKALKEAGFITEDKPVGESTREHRFMAREEFFVDEEGQYDVPTLSQLIRACGETVFSIHCSPHRISVEWHEALFDEQEVFEGSTPEEAVARLWLNLNKK